VSLQTEYYRDMVGNLTQIVNPNQTETTVAYDKVYRTLERINRQVTNGGKTNSGFKYSYNEVGHITEAIKEYGWRKPSVVTEAYEYDGLHRLSYMNMSPIKNNGGVVETAYSYDPVGNRLSWESNDDLQTNTPYDGFYRSYEYNPANQMLAMENAADKKKDDYAYEYSFDANGNRINRQLIDRNGPQYGVDYSYDPENRLVLAQDYQLVGGSKKQAAHRIDRAFTTLEYDGGGRRLVKHYDPKQGGNGVDKRDEYVFDGLDPVAEYNMLNGQRTDYYRGAGNHLALMHQYKGGTQGQMYWYHYNNKGDVVGLTKHNGNSHHNYRYDPYGAVLPENGNFTDPHNHYTLTGKEFDENTGLVWFGARHYEPETGVWMGQDSYRGIISDPMSLHRYGFVGNNPVSYWDWYGFEPKWGQLGTVPQIIDEINQVAGNDNSVTFQELIDHFEGNRFYVRDDDNNLIEREDSVNVQRYIYTTERGWIDMHHYFVFAKKYLELKETCEKTLYNRTDALTEALSYSKMTEFAQYFKHPVSAFSYEDLASNYAGIQFAMKYGDKLFNGEIKLDDALAEHMKSLGATNPQFAPNYDYIPHIITSDYTMKSMDKMGLKGSDLKSKHKKLYDDLSDEFKEKIKDAHKQIRNE
ncbi:MAG: RHS repeat-associated core domain-containing protein, partial [Candidatus Electrothrix sp. AW3_4]|nr:RHS repeat-associated core domain-containing protein [Candidatus Electrothrix gigas]